MSAVPDSTRCRVLREGYLDVKSPPDSPERILYKAWRRLWVIAAAFLPRGRGEPHLILQLSRKSDDEPPLKQVKASRDGLRLFRCNSGSRPMRTWAVSSGSSLLIYLAARTEMETQDWMETVRDGLWPPIQNPQGLSSDCYDVSLIDDEKSFASGLLGVYGRLVKTSDDTMSIIHPHWQGTQMRWLLADITGVRLVRKIGKEGEDAGVFNLSVKSSKKETRILHFYSKTASATIRWIQSVLEDSKTPKNLKDCKAVPEAKSDSTNHLLNPASQYAIVQKSKTSEQIQKVETTPPASDNISNDSLEKANNPSYFHLGNISGAFLDASLNAACSQTDENTGKKTVVAQKSNSGDDSDEDDFAELYDHIYEDLSQRRVSRGTVYEEVEDMEGDCEYIAPAPPTPPARQKPLIANRPNTLSFQKSVLDSDALRLKKLSESVTEALKSVEEDPQKVTETPPGVRRKRSKKSRSLQPSPTMETKPPPTIASECNCIVHRAHSEPDIKQVPLRATELPLRPFDLPLDCRILQKKELQQQVEKEVKTHLPLADLLKSLHVKNDLPSPTKDKSSTQVDRKSRQIPQLCITSSEVPSPPSPSGTEAEYIDMR